MTTRPNSDALTRALLNLASQGQRPRCSDPGAHEYWLSDDREERAQAATWCAGCPILTPCGAAGDAEAWGVWGGVDRTVTNRKEATA